MNMYKMTILFKSGATFNGVLSQDECDGVVFAYREFLSGKNYTNFITFNGTTHLGIFCLSDISGISSTLVVDSSY